MQFPMARKFMLQPLLRYNVKNSKMHNSTHHKGHWKGWALKISTFLGPKGTTRFARCHFRTQKSLDFQAPTPSNGPCNGCYPHQNHSVPRQINNRHINSYNLS